MLNRLPLIVLTIVALSVTGCLVHRYGDARLQRNSDALSITSDRLYLNPIPLDRAATHVRQVRNLPFPIVALVVELICVSDVVDDMGRVIGSVFCHSVGEKYADNGRSLADA
jgi:hypothetical protein